MVTNGKGKKSLNKKIVPKSNDDKYQIQSFNDFNIANLKNVIRYNPYAWMLIALFFIGLFLRLFNLGFNSLWLDEAVTFDFAKMSISEIFGLLDGTDTNPPLFYLAEHFMLLLGNNEVILRIIPALLGTLTIPIFYFIGKEISGKLCGIISSGLITFSTFHIFYSQEARVYTTLLLFFSLSILFYLIALKTSQIKYWVIFGVFASLSLWLHSYVFVGIAILLLHALIVNRKSIFKNIRSLKPMFIGILIFIILSLPLIISAIGIFIARTSTPPTWGIQGFNLLTNLIFSFSGSEVYLSVIFPIIAVIGIIYLYVNRNTRNYSYLLILSIILSVIIGIILSYKMPLYPRYLMYIMPFFFIAIASAFCIIPKEIDYKKVSVVVLILLCLISIPYLSTYYTNYTKEDWRGFSEKLSDVTENGDYIVSMPSYISLPLNYYYSYSDDNTIEKVADSTAMLEEIENERGNATAYYIVTGDIYAVDTSGKSVEWLSEKTDYLGQYIGINLFKSKQ